MKTLDRHIEGKLEDKEFKELFDEEKQFLELSLKIQNEREKKGLSQEEVAEKAHITQQQVSKIENGINCNIITLIRVCNALELNLLFQKQKLS